MKAFYEKSGSPPSAATGSRMNQRGANITRDPCSAFTGARGSLEAR
jgi:hypothetical protein